MKTTFQLISVAVLLSVTGISHAALSASSGPASFSGSVSVTATGAGVTSATNTNNGASVASVALGQFNSSTGVLTGVDLQLNSNRTQTISGAGNKNNGPGRTANGNGTSTAALSAAGASTTFTPAITQTGGAGCSLAQGPTGPISCSYGPTTSAATATNGTASVDNANLNDYVGSGNVNASLSTPTLSATSTLSSIMGQAGAGSSTTYQVAWDGTVQANYSYLVHADSSFNGSADQNSLSLDFGTVAQNSAANLQFSIFNLADSNRTGLDLDSFAGTGDTGIFNTNLAGFLDLAQGSSNLFSVSMLTDSLGAFSAQYILNLSDADIGASTTWQNQQLTLNVTGNVSAVPVPAAVWLFGTAMAGLIGAGRRKLAA